MTLPSTECINAVGIKKEIATGFWGRKKPILTDVSFKVPKGNIVGFVGPNGAGKSTTIKILLGAMKATAGSLTVFNEPPYAIDTKARVGYLPEIQSLPKTLKPHELIKLHLHLSRKKVVNATLSIEALMEKVGLTQQINQPMRGFSKGQQQRVGLALALCHEPELLILDEPMTGLDPIGRKIVRQVILEQKEKGNTVFFSSHILPDVEALCDEVIIINQGQTLQQGPIENILSNQAQGYEITVSLPIKVLTKKLNLTEAISARGLTSIIYVTTEKEMLELINKLNQADISLIKVEKLKSHLEDQLIDLLNQQEQRTGS
jgi:ABC-2 type transport system ATP-binding protein